ncbi:MAG TPA: formate dehydrogenase subunit gamma [Clostridia bacterium]|nr:formate dehydrogenase subunit gamma [Clostridia bacterium]
MATRAEHFDRRPRPSNPIDQIGRTVVYEGELMRHRAYTRFLHWSYGIFFFLALLSGFGIYLPWIFAWFTPLFGGGAMTRLLHPWFGLGFVFFFGLQVLNWTSLMNWKPSDSKWMGRIRDYVTHRETMESEDVGFFNAGQKLMFWEIVIGSAVYLITGVIMWFPATFGRALVSISYVLHDISALIMLAGIFVHIYLSTFGEPGTIQAMTRGTVSEAWAWTHHPGWYRQLTGRDPYQSVEDARERLQEEPPQTDPTKAL